MYPGKVIIAGAGPGDPDLITLKAIHYLNIADVILADRLVNEQILNLYANPKAEIIFVGKQGNSKNSVPQEKINRLLVEHAFKNKLVVRLKGGDVATYSNVLDELKTLNEYHVSYEIVPGITAASGASAYSGIPLTARGYADSVRYLTYHNKVKKTEAYWQDLAKTNDTLVLYMSGNNIGEFIKHLSEHHVTGKSIAVIEQATTPYQKIAIYTFNDFTAKSDKTYTSPTIIIIGKVVDLYDRFAWQPNSEQDASYFRDLNSRKYNYKEHLL